KNGAGKSAIGEALMLALGVIKPQDVKEPVKRGEASATLDVLLTDGTRVHRKIGARGREWTVTAADGEVLEPSTDLGRLSSKKGCTPIAFLRLRPADQIDALLAAVGKVAPVDRVREITGEDLPPHENESAAAYLERLSADKVGLFYVRRLEAGRTATQ